MNNDSDTHNILDSQVDALILAGIDPAQIYAIAMTDGLMPSEENYQSISSNDLEEWDEHYKEFGELTNRVKTLIVIAKKNPDYKPGDEQYIGGAIFASLVSGIALGTEISDCSADQQACYNKAIWIYDKIHQYEMAYHRLEVEKRMKLD